MNKEVKTLLVTLGVALGLIWLFKPKKDSETKVVEDKYSAPKEATEDTKKEKEQAIVGLQAMRQAIDAGEKKSELDKLSAMILKENCIKVVISKKTGLLRAMNKKGSVVAEEELKK
jgi:nitrogen fixation protein FixH